MALIYVREDTSEPLKVLPEGKVWVVCLGGSDFLAQQALDHEVLDTYSGIETTIYAVNVDKQPKLAQSLGAFAYPVLIKVSDGVAQSMFVGMFNTNQVKAIISTEVSPC